MVKNMLAPALTATAATALCLCLAIGGCRKTTNAAVVDPPREAAPAATGGESGAQCRRLPVIGRDDGLMGRLEEPTVVRASLYRNGEAADETAEVGLDKGTWLVPGGAIAEDGQ